MNPRAIIEGYLDRLENMSRAPETIRKYRHILLNLQSRLDGKTWAEVKQEDLLNFLTEKGKSRATLINRHITLKAFYGWMLEQNHVLINLMLKIDKPKPVKLLPKNIMTKGEVQKVMATHQVDSTDHTEFRNRVILELMYSCSLRRSEVSALEVKDVDLSSNALRVAPGKTKTGRLVPLGQVVSSLLGKYLDDVRPGVKASALFVSRLGKKLSPTMISKIARDARKASGIRTKASSHSFRKSSATHMLRNGAPLISVQALLGHKKPTTTEVYTKIYPKDLIKMHKASHPRERQKNLRLQELELPKWLYQGRAWKLD